MRLGIVGSGKIVKEYLPVLQQMEGMEVVALMNAPTSKSLFAVQKEFGVPHAVHSMDELVALGCDTAYVAVPNTAHFAVAKDALEHGLHTIVEKPFTMTSEEASELAAVALRNHLFLWEAITTLHLDGWQWIKDRIPAIGRLRLVTLNYSQYSSRYDAFRQGEILPAFDPALGGGALMDLNVYNVHFLLSFFGVPETFYYAPNMDRGVDTSGVLLLSYPDFQATAIAAKDAGAPAYCTLEGTDGILTMSEAAGRFGTITLTRRTLPEGNPDNLPETESMTEIPFERRAEPLFRSFQRMLKEEDWEKAGRLLDHSLEVVALLEKVHKEAGLGGSR